MLDDDHSGSSPMQLAELTMSHSKCLLNGLSREIRRQLRRSRSIACATVIVSCCLLSSAGCNSRKPTAMEKPPAADTATPPKSEPPTADATDVVADIAADVVAESEEVDVASAEKSMVNAEPGAEVQQTWSTQRVVALLPNGPIVIDISVNIDGQSLEEATDNATRATIARIERDLKRPWTWEQLLDHPLTQSGWLGNLVPKEDQRAQLIAMYDKDSNDEVEDAELAEFLTRGLARSSPLRFTDIGNAPDFVASESPWHQLDLNHDSQLDETELDAASTTLSRYDLNADHILTLQELQSDRSASDSGMSTSGMAMLDYKSSFAIDSKQKNEKVALGLIRKYTSFDSLTRDVWSRWDDKLWSEFDTNSDGILVTEEVERITTTPPALALKFQFHQDGSASAIQAAVGKGEEVEWNSRLPTSGKINGRDFLLMATVNDSFSSGSRSIIRNQLAASLGNPQLAAAIRTQLQLGDEAFKTLDADSDGQLSDAEFNDAWQWLTAIRGNRILARWMVADKAWFQIADNDGDNRLTEIELQKLSGRLAELDRDRDGLLSPNELPLAIRLEIARTDNRLNLNLPSSGVPTPSDSGWFAATDSNSDGFISNAEFVGSMEDFQAYDSDNDGFISREEAYKARKPHVQ